jgi:hypothetical protein
VQEHRQNGKLTNIIKSLIPNCRPKGANESKEAHVRESAQDRRSAHAFSSHTRYTGGTKELAVGVERYISIRFGTLAFALIV